MENWSERPGCPTPAAASGSAAGVMDTSTEDSGSVSALIRGPHQVQLPSQARPSAAATLISTEGTASDADGYRANSSRNRR